VMSTPTSVAGVSSGVLGQISAEDALRCMARSGLVAVIR
jgi:hypothetical protein